MFILIDYADVYSTAKPLEWPPIDGVTTVRTILHREGKELLGVRHLIQHLPARRAPNCASRTSPSAPTTWLPRSALCTARSAATSSSRFPFPARGSCNPTHCVRRHVGHRDRRRYRGPEPRLRLSLTSPLSAQRACSSAVGSKIDQALPLRRTPWPLSGDFLVQAPRRRRFPRHGENGGTRCTRTKHAYSWSSLRPLGVIWGHSRSMRVSRPRE